MINYKVLSNRRIPQTKSASYDIEVYLINDNEAERLPTESELMEISKKIKGENKKAKFVYISFFLPGMALNKGAFATAHHTPEMKIKMMPFMLFDTKYDYFLEETK